MDDKTGENKHVSGDFCIYLTPCFFLSLQFYVLTWLPSFHKWTAIRRVLCFSGCNQWLAYHTSVPTLSVSPLFPQAVKLYSYCSVLVGFRNVFERGLLNKNPPSQSNWNNSNIINQDISIHELKFLCLNTTRYLDRSALKTTRYLDRSALRPLDI